MSDLLDYKCPACGGAMEFDSKLQKMKCPYCDTTVEMKDMKGKDEALDSAKATADDEIAKEHYEWESVSNSEWTDEETANMSVFTCNSCGGEIVGDGNTAASECPFCGNPVVMTGRFSGNLKPDYVIPFKLDKKQAKEKYLEHIKGKKLLPNLFKQENRINEIKGVYVPFWLFDSKVKAYARFEGRNIRTWSDRKYNYTETTTYDVFREGIMSFSNIPVDGSRAMDDDLMESIEPFNFKEAVPFQTAYMAGYFADKYDVDSTESETRANERLRQSTIDILKSTVDGRYMQVSFYDNAKFKKQVNQKDYNDPFKQLTNNSAVQMLEGRIKYALYPVWLLTTTYKGEKYTFAMNGQTGKFVGNLPMDKSKAFKAFAIVTAIATLIATPAFWFILN